MKKAILNGLLFLSLTIAAALAYVYYDYTRASALNQSVTLYFKKGSGFREIAHTLSQAGVIENKQLFTAQAALTGKYRQFKPGEYVFPAGISPKGVMDTLVLGRRVAHKITIAEGMESAAILELLRQEPLLSGEVPDVVAEGSLLPETYHFEREDDRSELLGRMQAGLANVLDLAWETRKEGLPFTTKEEALTLASIIEKETGVEAERRRIAAVYINRLKQNILLQADPTTMYGIKLVDGKMDRPLTLSDLKRDIPYNTYVRSGLPPGPICNPGRASIEAALNPLDSDELFFVATGDGGHYFGATLKEHNENVAKYRQELKIRLLRMNQRN